MKRILLPLLLLVALCANAAGSSSYRRRQESRQGRGSHADPTARRCERARAGRNDRSSLGSRRAMIWRRRTCLSGPALMSTSKTAMASRRFNLASANGNGAMVEMLLKAGADANTALSEGETVLMAAARTGKPEAVKALLDHGADVNAKESWRGQTALMWAAAEGNSDVIKLLLARGADMKVRSNGGFTAFLFAAREGRIPAVKTFLELGASLNESLLVRGRGGRGGAAARCSAEPEPGANAFMLAAENAHYELAAFLLDAGADPNAAPQGWTALHQVTWIRKAGLGDNNPAPSGSGNMGSLEFVRALAKHGANLNARVTKRPGMGTTSLNSIGATPFLLAARTADADLMRLLDRTRRRSTAAPMTTAQRR